MLSHRVKIISRFGLCRQGQAKSAIKRKNRQFGRILPTKNPKKPHFTAIFLPF